MKLTENKQEIKRLIHFDGGITTVGKEGVEKIVVYEELGNGSYIPWFEIWKRGKIFSQVNSLYIADVIYSDEPLA